MYNEGMNISFKEDFNMKLAYLEPKADVRFLLSQDIIAASEEGTGPLEPESNRYPDDAVEDPF